MRFFDAILPRVSRKVAGLFIGVVAGISPIAVQAVDASPAFASATGCTFFGAPIHSGVHNGQYCATVHGTGTYINNVTGNFGTTIPGLNSVCNPSIKLDVFDRWDHWIASRQGPQLSGCSWGAFYILRSITVNWGFPHADGGRLYITLQSSGSRVAVVSFYFHS